MNNGSVQRMNSEISSTEAESQNFGTFEAQNWQVAQVPVEARNGAHEQQMGAQALENTEVAELEQSAELAQEVAGQENLEESTGVETPLQAEERLQEDAENLANEDNPQRDSEAKIVYKNEEKKAHEVMAKMDKIVNQERFVAKKVLEEFARDRDETLLMMENPRKIGDRN